jgi:hypothetical protein
MFILILMVVLGSAPVLQFLNIPVFASCPPSSPGELVSVAVSE